MMKKTDFILKMYAITSTLVISWMLFSGFKPINTPQRFDEITVERINVVEADGTLKMVISNKERQHPGLINGVVSRDRERAPGIIFFSEEDEIGGLIFGGDKESGNTISLTTDKWKNDQVMQLAQMEFDGGKKSFYGLNILERPDDPTLETVVHLLDSLEDANVPRELIEKEYFKLFDGKQPLAGRVFVGKKSNNSGGVWLTDRNNNPRLNIYIDGDNVPHLDLLDEEGNIVKDLLK